jgi:hypothetical protein
MDFCRGAFKFARGGASIFGTTGTSIFGGGGGAGGGGLDGAMFGPSNCAAANGPTVSTGNTSAPHRIAVERRVIADTS